MNVPLSCPDITDAEIQAVIDVMESKRLSLGDKQIEFERMMAKYIGVDHAVAVNSGTSGLHLIIRSLGIGEDDEVITTPFSFVASTNCILMERAKPIFADIDMQTLNIDPGQVVRKISERTKAILAVDIFGMPCKWTEIEAIAKNYGLKLIEDSCEALGASYYGKKCGSFGTAGTFGFYPNKQITTLGEGGMITTDDEEIAELCRSMRNQGRGYSGEWFEHVRLGYNYRLPEAACAMGIIQLKRINEILTKREKVASWYSYKLQDISEIITPNRLIRINRSWFVYVIILKHSNRDEVASKLKEVGIQCGKYFPPIHLLPFTGDAQRMPVTEYVAYRTLALPFHPNLTEKEVDYVVDNLKKCIKGEL